MTSIRPARPDEVPVLQDLYDRALDNSFIFSPDMRRDRAYLEVKRHYFERIIADDGSVCLIAEIEGQPIAYVTAAPRNEPLFTLRFVEVDNLGVLEAYRNQGIGQQLMDAITAWAKQQGYHKMYVTTFAGNIGARRFYDRNGFSELEVGLTKDL